MNSRVPEAHTDYIIAVISEEFGSVVSILIISIFLFIAFRITKIIINSKNNFNRLSLCGLISLLIFQTFVHVGVNANLLPTTGMTLPFLSYGGSSLVGSAILAGVILNYTKNKIYLSYTEEIDEKCFNTSLIVGDINYKKIILNISTIWTFYLIVP